VSTDDVYELHDRLRKEIDALGLSLADVARAIGDNSSQGIRDICSGRKRASAEFVGRVARAIPIDVLYILTGQRSGSASVAPPSPRQAALLDNFEHLSEDDKRALERTASALAQSQSGHMKKAG
jgi:transcriptional regulator with XRE-family HTH domain